MLSDDVSEVAGKTVSTAAAVLGGTVRGGLLGAAATFVAGSLGLAGAAAYGAMGLGAGAVATAALHGAVIGAATLLTGALPLVIAGAAVGAALLGIGALIPGVSDMWKGAKKAMHRDRETEDRTQVVEVHHEHSCPPPQTRRTIVYDNPDFEPGHGTRMKERGDCAQTTTVCR